jgi:hypothetical protein
MAQFSMSIALAPGAHSEASSRTSTSHRARLCLISRSMLWLRFFPGLFACQREEGGGERETR